MSDHTPQNENYLESPSQDTKVEGYANTGGGREAWCTVAGGWLALFGTFGYISSFGVYQDLYVLAGTSTSSGISWIGSTQLWLFVFMGLPAGALLDKGYFKQVVFVGTLIYLFSIFMLSLAHVDCYYQVFLSQGVGMGIGSGLIYLPAMAVQSHHWKARRALAMGIVITGSSVGGIVYPILLNKLFHGSIGFAWGVRASGLLSMGVLASANLLMSAKPQDSESGKPKAKVSDIITDAPFMLVAVIGGSLLAWGLFFPYFYLQVYADLHNLPSNFAFYTLTIQNGASIFGRTIPNLLADRLGVINVSLIMLFGTGVLLFFLLGVPTIGSMAVFSILYGFFSGGALSLTAPIMASFIRDTSEIGVRMGVAYTLGSFAYLTGPPISGALLSSPPQWNRPIVFSGAVILVGSIPVLSGRWMQARRKNTQYV